MRKPESNDGLEFIHLTLLSKIKLDCNIVVILCFRIQILKFHKPHFFRLYTYIHELPVI